MEFVKNAIGWFEIPVSDFERAKKFYSTILDYEMPEMDFPPIRMGILLYNREEGGIGGAICHGEGYTPSGQNGVKIYLDGGSDLNIILNRVAAAGGQVTLSKVEIAPGMGYMAFFNDTEGNSIGLHSMN